MKDFVLLENRKTQVGDKNSYYFHDLDQEIICHQFEKLFQCLDAIEKLSRAGKFLVGFMTYEAGLHWQTRLAKLKPKTSAIALPLLHFAAFTKCDFLNQQEVNDLLLEKIDKKCQENFIYNLQWSLDKGAYLSCFEKIKKYLREGQTYQVNLTGKYHFNFNGNPVNFYQLLREQQRVEYSALLYFSDYQILSLSPELFFKKNNNCIIAKPMKGTMPRATDPLQDQQNAEFLQTDIKSRAENLMIVDLLRNDIGRLAEYDSVKVNKLFAVETFETMHQMISEITGELSVGTNLQQLFTALFPCGSVTGAPKIKTMEIIHELEPSARGVYTGAIGYLTPNGDMCFNVPIRTLVLQNNCGELGVGSGIVYDSDVREEWAETQLKAKFLTQLDPGFELIESFFYSKQGGYRYLSQHLARLFHSAKIFNFAFDETDIVATLAKNRAALMKNKNYKIKLTLNKQGKITIHNEIITPCDQVAQIIIADEAIDSRNILLQHKTTAASVRGFYQTAFEYYCQKNNYFDVIFKNEQGHITEGSRSNVFVQINDEIFTSPVNSGLLSGVMRENFIKRYHVIEKPIILEEFVNADKIWVSNSVRGILQATNIKSSGKLTVS